MKCIGFNVTKLFYSVITKTQENANIKRTVSAML